MKGLSCLRNRPLSKKPWALCEQGSDGARPCFARQSLPSTGKTDLGLSRKTGRKAVVLARVRGGKGLPWGDRV